MSSGGGGGAGAGTGAGTGGGGGGGGGEALTSERLEQLNKENVSIPEKRSVKVGYKNIPSLDAITARLAKTRTLSIDGTPKPPEPEMIEDPKTPGVPLKIPEHPLQYSWLENFFFSWLEF